METGTAFEILNGHSRSVHGLSDKTVESYALSLDSLLASTFSHHLIQTLLFLVATSVYCRIWLYHKLRSPNFEYRFISYLKMPNDVNGAASFLNLHRMLAVQKPRTDFVRYHIENVGE